MEVLCQLFYTRLLLGRKNWRRLVLTTVSPSNEYPNILKYGGQNSPTTYSAVSFSSWQALVSYLQKSNNVAAKGHLENLTDVNKLKTMLCYVMLYGYL